MVGLHGQARQARHLVTMVLLFVPHHPRSLHNQVTSKTCCLTKHFCPPHKRTTQNPPFPAGQVQATVGPEETLQALLRIRPPKQPSYPIQPRFCPTWIRLLPHPASCLSHLNTPLTHQAEWQRICKNPAWAIVNHDGILALAYSEQDRNSGEGDTGAYRVKAELQNAPE